MMLDSSCLESTIKAPNTTNSARESSPFLRESSVHGIEYRDNWDGIVIVVIAQHYLKPGTGTSILSPHIKRELL